MTVVTAPAWRAAFRSLEEHGLAQPNLGDIAYQSIAGAISTATHGTGAELPTDRGQGTAEVAAGISNPRGLGPLDTKLL